MCVCARNGKWYRALTIQRWPWQRPFTLGLLFGPVKPQAQCRRPLPSPVRGLGAAACGEPLALTTVASTVKGRRMAGVPACPALWTRPTQ